MITVNLKGGLGNQMFQYACGRALSLRNNDGLKIVAEGLEKANEVGDIYRPFSLQNFTISGELVPASSITLWQKIVRKINHKVWRQFYINFDPVIFNKKGDVFLDGYFQSEKYFADFSDKIRDDFTLQEELSGAAAEAVAVIKGDSAAVSLHVRRGDYVTHPNFGGIVDLPYYQHAIAEIKKQVPDARFYIFSDDIAWCRTKLQLPADAVFVSGPELKDYEELTLMSLCQHHIIANSSFSWWGAWLGKNPDKIVIAPKKWSNLHESWYRDIIPSTWIRL